MDEQVSDLIRRGMRHVGQTVANGKLRPVWEFGEPPEASTAFIQFGRGVDFSEPVEGTLISLPSSPYRRTVVEWLFNRQTVVTPPEWMTAVLECGHCMRVKFGHTEDHVICVHCFNEEMKGGA